MTNEFSYPVGDRFWAYCSGIAIALLSFFIVFEDSLFSISDAEELFSEQNIKLVDDFELLKNESISSIGGDYFLSSRLSTLDKETIVRLIRTSPDFSFKKNETRVDDSLFLVPNRHTGKETIHNYETHIFFITELFNPQGI